MKFLFVTEYYPPVHMGGAEISLKILAEGLARLGHQVTVLTPNYLAPRTEVESRENLRIVRFKSPRYYLFKRRNVSHEVYTWNKPLFYLQLSQYIRLSSYELKKEVEKLLKSEDFDVIHANNLESILAVSNIKTDAVKVAHLRDFGILCWNRGLNNKGNLCPGCSVQNIEKCMETNFLLASMLASEIRIRQKTLNNFDKLIAISKFVKRQFVRQLGINEDKIAVLYNPIDPTVISELSKPEARKYLGLPVDGRIVLFVGTLTEQKGAHIVLELAKRLSQYYFVVVGEGPLRERFSLANLSNLKYVGYKPLNELKHYYKAADILLVPSLWHEPFGRVIVEGAVNGCYVIGSDRGAIPEVIEHFRVGTYIVPTVLSFVEMLNKHCSLSFRNKNNIEITKSKLSYPDYHNQFIRIVVH